MAFIGNTVQTQGFTPAIDYFNGNGVTVTFTLSRPVVSVAQMIVAVDNVIQNPSSAFTVSGSSITFTSAPLSGTNNIWVEYTSLITTYQGISQDPTVIGDIRATGGYLAEGDFGNSYVDGTIVDYVTGNARITTGPIDDMTFYHGGTASRSEMMKLSYAGNSTLTGNLAISGSATIQGLTVGKGTASLRNTVVGQGALNANTTGFGGTYIGYQTGYTNTTGTSNTFIGEQSGYFNTTGTYNTGVGQGSYASNSTSATGSYNTSLGALSLYNNTTASYNTAIGYQSLYSNTTAVSNTAVGFTALYANSTGAENAALGVETLKSNTTGSFNVGIGKQALYLNTTASYNTAVGYQAGYSTTTGTRITALGNKATYTNTTGNYNTSIGHESLLLNSTGSFNTACGDSSLRETTGSYNTALGMGAGQVITSGSKNTIVGTYNGNQNSLDIRTSSNYIVLSDGDGNPRVISNGSGEISMNTTPATGYTLTLKGAAGGAQGILYGVNAGSTFTIRIQGDGSIYNYYGTYGTISDARLKENIVDATPKLADLMQVKVRNYNLIDDEFKTKQIGVIAQELETVFPNMVTEDEDGNKAVKSAVFVPMLIKSIQELKATVDAQAARIASLEGAK